MEIVSLDGQFALKVPLQKPYTVKRYEPYGEEVKDATIATITEDMYVDWEVSETYNNIDELLLLFRDCCRQGIYAKKDIENCERFIKQQDNFGEIEPSKTYYDSRIINGMNKEFNSSVLVAYDTDSSQEIPQKSKNFPFWIEVHCSKTKDISIHICFRINIEKVSEENILFILDTESKYIFPEAYRIFTILWQSKALNIKIGETPKSFQDGLKSCIDEYQIKEAFGLIAGEYNIQKAGQSDEKKIAYSISPTDNNGRVSIGFKQYVEFINNKRVRGSIFKSYKLNFYKCDFKDELIVQELHDVQVTFWKCTFEKEVRFNNATFMGETIFKESTFNDIVDFRNSEFLENNSSEKGRVDFYRTSFKKQVSFSDVSFKTFTDFLGTIFEADVDFKNAQCESILFEAKFQGIADFQGANLKKQTSFKNAVFSDYANFNHTKFFGEANFFRAHFKGGAYFTDSSFKQNACFVAVTFHSNANFDQVEFQVGEDCKSESIADFSGAHFQKTAELNATFGHDAKFRGAIFNDNAEFGDAEFLRKAIFCGAQFKKDALFLNTIFQEADFNQGKFYQNAYFYGATFQDFPKFLQAIFSGDVNFTNTELDFGFDDTRGKIEKTYNDIRNSYHAKKNKKSKEEPKKHKIANEFRDSFRNIKSSLIKNHNMLDASNYHRVELYCKELELKYKKEKGTRDVIDRIQLMFYRLTSDHHTDLLLILNNVIFLIAWFGFMNGALNFLFNQDYFDLSIEKILMALGAFVACFIFTIITLCFMFGYFKIFFVAYARKRLYCKIRKLWKQFNLRQLFNKYKNKNGIFCIAYIITAIILVVKPALLVPIFGQMIDTKSSIGFAFASLNIIYAIFMFLLIFSLQKTARKNTIVPN